LTFFSFWPTDPPTADRWFVPLLAPAVLVAVGLLLYFRGAAMESIGARAPYKLLGVPLCFFAFLLGCLVLARWLSDPVYQAVVTSGRVKAGQIGAPLLGAAGLVTILIYRVVAASRTHRT
jgi:hypothetical protein